MILRIATRKSPLALWQANHVYDLIRSVDRSLKVFLVPIQTKVDKNLDLKISDFGGKGAFSKEVQELLLSARADIAVHSAKDLEVESPKGLQIAAYPTRGNVHDALVGSKLENLEHGATVATGSNRRKALLLEQRPDLNIIELRGNIDTRLKKLGSVDALVMASCALDRLNKSPDVVEELDPDVFIPQVGQGALAVEARDDDFQILELLKSIDHQPTRLAVETERSFLRQLGGDCDLPAGARAVRFGSELKIRGFLSDDDGQVARAEVRGFERQEPGKRLAQRLVEMHSRK